MAEILSEQEVICHLMQNILDEATLPWGVNVERVEIKVSIEFTDFSRAAREARAKVVAAEGNHKASIHLKDAALSALQLRYLQVKIGN